MVRTIEGYQHQEPSKMLLKKKRGVSPVVSSIIMSAVVLVIGSTIWFFAQSAATVIAEDYIDDILALKDEATERFAVEHVTNNSDCTELYLSIYNYGDVNVTVDSYAFVDNYTYSSDLGNSAHIGKQEIINVTIDVNATSGDEVAIKVHSRRQNNAYATYIVP